MKRINCFLALVLAALCLVSSAFAAPEDALLEHAVAMAVQLDELASCEIYVSLFFGSEEIAAQVAQWGEESHAVPSAAYKIAVSQAQIDALLTAMGEAPASLTGSVRQEMTRRLASSVGTMINAGAGSEALAASSVVSVQTAFLLENMTDICLYLLFFDDAAPVLVSFCPAEDGTVMASAGLIVAETLNEEAMDDLREELGGLLGETVLEKIQLN